MSDDDLMRDVDALIAAAARCERADFEAALYRGSREYKRAHEAEEAFLEARVAFEKKWAPGPVEPARCLIARPSLGIGRDVPRAPDVVSRLCREARRTGLEPRLFSARARGDWTALAPGRSNGLLIDFGA